MSTISGQFYNSEEWKYIQAILKYRLDLHFYLSQGKLKIYLRQLLKKALA